MDEYFKEQVNNLAEDLINMLEISVAGQDMNSVIEKLGGKYTKDTSLDFSSSGVLHRKAPDVQFSIIVPKNMSKERQNYIAAYQLGHLFLHMGYLIDTDIWKKTNATNCYYENNPEAHAQAEAFALAFLMPKTMFRKTFKQYTNDNYVFIGQVANYFHVNVDVATLRAKQLNYF